MDTIKFTKMEGIGNDYIYIDSTQQNIQLPPNVIARLSDRHFGIGSDGVIFIRPSETADFQMDMYNSDGSRSEMCGNGIRCVAKYVYDHGLTKEKSTKIETGAGVLELDLQVDLSNKVSEVTVDMGEPILIPAKIPVNWKSENPILDQPIEVQGHSLLFSAVSMGNPHCIIHVDDPDKFPVHETGSILENRTDLFPNRINVEFVALKEKDHIYQRTWERGAGETLACGTGACAVAVSSHLTGRTGRSVRIDLRGGTLKIHWAENNHVFMTGPAREVFTGEWKL